MNGLLVFLFSGNFNSKLDYYGFFFVRKCMAVLPGQKKWP